MSPCLRAIFLLQKLLMKTKVFSGLSNGTEKLLKVADVICFFCPASFLPPGCPFRGLLFGCSLFSWYICGDTAWLRLLSLQKVETLGEKCRSRKHCDGHFRADVFLCGQKLYMMKMMFSEGKVETILVDMWPYLESPP